MGFIKRIFQLSLSKREIVRSKRFMAILMIPIFVIQMSSLNLFLMQAVIAEDGESDVVAESEEIKEAPPEEEPAPDEIEKADPPKEEIKSPEVEEVSKESPTDEEAPVALEEIIPNSISEVIDEVKEEILPVVAPEIIQEEAVENDEGGRITPEAAYDENLEAPTQSPVAEEPKAEEGWRDNSDGSSSIMVMAGNEYEFKDSGLKIKFTRIDNGTGEITVKEIELTPEQVIELGALSNKAWDITSDMADGTFEYELTLPVVENVDESKIQLVYVEEKEDLNDENKIKAVEKEDVKVDNDKNELTANGLDHFTIFVATFSDISLSISDTQFKSGDTVFVKAGGGLMNNRYYKIAIDPPGNNNVSYISSCQIGSVGSFSAQYLLPNNAQVSDSWKVLLHGFDNIGECTNNNHPSNSANQFFEVIDSVVSKGSTISNSCIDDLFPGNLTCSANDIDIANVTGITINDDGCAFPGDTVTFTADWEVASNSSERYDVGLYFSTDGDPNSDGAYTGKCSITTLSNSSTPPWFDFDGDFCGDASSSANVKPTIQQTVQCLDTDGNNKLNLPYCTSWRQNVGDICNSPTDAYPGTPSKCNCNKGFEIPIVVPYGAEIEVKKDLIPSIDGGKFNLQIDGIDRVLGVGDGGTTGEVVISAGTSASPGAIHTVGETAGTGTTLSDYASSISCVDRGTSTFDGGAPLTFSGTGVLNVDVDKNDDIVCTITNTLKTGTLEVKKDVVPDDSGTNWNISISGPTSSNDSLSGDGTTGALSVNPGSYTITETAGSGTDLSDYNSTWACTIGGADSTSGSGTSASVTVAENETAVCVFTNTLKAGHLIVQKTTFPAGDLTSFSINASGTGTITGGGSGNVSDAIDYDYEVASGTYSVTESVPSGWGLTSNGCLNVAVGAGETKYCTIVNKKLPILTIEKVLVGETKPFSDFSFILDGWSTTQFEADGNNNIYVAPDQAYAITETDPGSGYNVSYSAGCTGALTYEQTATCTITNTRYGSLTIVKDANPDSSQSFAFTTSGTGLSDFTLSDDGIAGHSNSKTFNSLLPGEYSVMETADSFHDWDLTGITCSDGSSNTAINISAGESVTCTFSNVMRGHIVIQKNAIPDSSQEFTFNNNFGNGNPATFGLTDDATTGFASRSFQVLPGTYSVSEDATVGWKSPDSATCGDGSPISAIEVAAGETVVCTFTNEKLATITLVKKTIGGDATFDFTLTGTGLPATTQLTTVAGTSQQIFSNLDPDNIYKISENTVPTGWANIGGVCNNGDAINNITPDAGENITCTFTNEKLNIDVTKTANPTTIAEPGGNVSFEVRVNNTSSVSVELTSLIDNVYGDLDGQDTCDIPKTILAGGSYECSFNGNVTGDVGSTHTDTVTAVASGVSDSDDATVTIINVNPTISVVKTANPTSVPETGGDVTYTFRVSNTSVESVTVTSLSDDRFGPLTGNDDCKIGTVLVGGGYCSFDTTFSIPAGDYPGSHVNVFTANAKDNEGNEATATDDATVTYTDVLPDITVTKDANPTSVPETGGDVKFTYTVTNNSIEAGTITGLADDKFGLLTGDDDCKVGTVLASKASCSFEATFAVPTGNAAGTHVDEFKATVTDGDGNDDTATDDATVTYIGANITLDPLSATNNINDAHTFTATVMENPGNGWVAASGELVTFTLVNNAAGASFVSGNTCTTDVSGKCTIQINSTSPGTVEIKGAVDVGLLAFTLHRETDGTLGSSVNAVKTYEAGKIIIEKQTLPDESDQSFEFDPSWSDINNFNLTDGQQNDSGWLEPGTYSVAEIVPSGWDLTDVTCNDSNPTVGVVASAAVISGANINLDAGETVTCVFTNTKFGSISGTKWEDMNGDGTKNAEDLPISGWTIKLDKDANGSIDQTTTTDSNGNYSFDNLFPGNYKVLENNPSPWNVFYPSAGVNYYTGINLAAGANLTGYDFGNSENGQIKGYKWEDIDGDGNKEDGEGVPASQWQIKLWKEVNGTPIDQGSSVYTDPATGAFSFSVSPGTYYLSEVLQSGWAQTWPDGSLLAPDGVTRLLGPIEVTSGSISENNNFGNFQNISVTVCKVEDADGDKETTLDQKPVQGWSMTLYDDAVQVGSSYATGADGCYTWTNLGPGNYSVSEENRSDWTNLDSTSHGFGVIESGDTSKSWTFVNSRLGKVIVKKVMVGGTDSFDFTGDVQGTISTNNGTIALDNVVPGDYTSIESVKTGWDLNSISCDDNDSLVDIPTRSTIFRVGSGETVTCTFNNTQRGKIIIEKQTLPDGSAQSFEFDPSWSDINNFNLTDGQQNDSGWLSPETYSVSEIALDGWDLTEATCSDQSSIDAISLQAGEIVTCVITNTQKASVDVYKFNDLNGNSNYDENEPYLSNWEMKMTEVEGESYKQMTNDNGHTIFSLEPDEYDLSETMQDGWSQSGIYCEGDDRESTLITAPGEAYGHHGNCSGWNGCGDAATCAQWACEVNGYEKVFSFGAQKPCTEFNNCNLFNSRGSVQKNWGNWCEVMGVTDIYCGDPVDDDSSDMRSAAVVDADSDNNYKLALDPGDSKKCYVGNFQKGDLTVLKYEDTDGILGRTEGEEFWLGDPTFTFRLYEDTGDKWQLVSEQSTNNEGKAQFEDVFESTGGYFVCEVKKDGWEDMRSLYNSTNNQSGATDEYPVCEGININSSGYSTNVEFGNARYSDLHGYKWEDLNGNRERDCKIKEADGNLEPSAICEEEDLLSGWTINLYREIGDGLFETEPFKTMETDSGEGHFGWYWFEHLLPGQYKVCEVLQDGWTQTYPNNDGGNCHIVNLPDGNFYELNESRNYVYGPKYNFGNQFVEPELTILKYNNQWPTVQSPGSVIDYTIEVEAQKNNVKGVVVTDLPPEGFKYISGSWSATSSLGGGHDGKLELSHEYASPGEWDLGDMKAGEVVTLSYKAQIDGAQQPGLYNDLAWADGTDNRSARVLATSMPAPAVDPGEITDNFVGTQIELAVAPLPQNVELEEDKETETKTKKKVLGVTTYLPATGTPTMWIILAILILIAGISLMIFARRRNDKIKNMKDKTLMLAVIVTGMMFLGADAQAMAPAIRLAQPTTPTEIKNQNIAFTVLDIDNRPVTVDCYKKGPADSDWVKFSTVGLPSGGSSGVCAINLDIDGGYDFYTEATAGGEVSKSKTVSLVLNTAVPGTPRKYNRNGGSCSVSFTTADDGGLTGKVVMYRSKNTEFVADNSTKVQEGNFGSNIEGVLTDPNDNCDDYYYAIQAVSEGGIGSDFTGDEDVDVETRTRTRTVYEENIVYTGGGAIPVEETEGTITEEAGATATEGGVTEEGTVQGEATEGALSEGAETEQGKVAGMFSEKNSKYGWVLVGLAVLGATYYVMRRRAKKKSELPLDEN